MRILNAEVVTSHGNQNGRRAMIHILEAGLQAADPYANARLLIRLQGGDLHIGHSAFEPSGSPHIGELVFGLAGVGRIYVVGAGKGVQRVAKVFEDVLGDRLCGGHVIDKKGHPVILQRIGVTLGGHPLPDEDCVRGCERILEVCQGLRPEDLVFTIAANGISSLLTMPVPGVTLEEVRRTTYIMQAERGAPTVDLNPVRNHLDQMKGGRISQHIHPARAVHVLAVSPLPWDDLMRRNLWLHTLPDCTTFASAVAALKKWNAWEAVPVSVREHLTQADPRDETVKAEELAEAPFVFGLMPEGRDMLDGAVRQAREQGLTPHVLTRGLIAEAREAGLVVASIAEMVERRGQPFAPPCALFTAGELLVTVGKAHGVGGRNQEFALAAALRIDGSNNVIIGSVDSDGTDGPGAQFTARAEAIPCLAGGIVDGYTAALARASGIDIFGELMGHNATPALWKLNSGVVAEPGISVNDLGVVLVLGRE